jgi:hypothetical protein
MIHFSDWLPYAVVGVTFTTLALLKVYGFRKGIVGGGGKPAACRLVGRCPTWSNKVNVAMVLFFLAIGLTNLALLLRVLMSG